MCGIAGSFGIEDGEKLVEEMLGRIAHRGPDGKGLQRYGDAVHGHVRLALRDLTDASAQPFSKQGGVLCYNGELWNDLDLKADAESRGRTFCTTGDTEVLAALLDEKGEAALSDLDGMFALAYSKGEDHFVARDLFGKIPVYIAKVSKGKYLWASERKAFPKKLNPLAVPAGCLFDLVTGQWRRHYTMPNEKMATTDASKCWVLEALRAGVEKRMSADAPVCVLVSGGLDSSSILALALEKTNNVTAYTATFDRSSEDARSARRICDHFGVSLVEVPVDASTSAVKKAMLCVEISSKAQIEIATLCLPLAKRIYSDGFKACLSGEAADELFGGYGNFCIKASKASDSEVVVMRKQQLAKMARGNFVRCNKAFMAHGVECRLPFMEQSLVECTVQLGKAKSPLGKKLLKEATEPILPAWVTKRQKDTFQGGSGLSKKVANDIANPVRYYNSQLRSLFGYLPKD
tara:strand:+ start:3993 stop:5378 length:1386 start_codon:yes stop_codon:yes gene_type:complete